MLKLYFGVIIFIMMSANLCGMERNGEGGVYPSVDNFVELYGGKTTDKPYKEGDIANEMLKEFKLDKRYFPSIKAVLQENEKSPTRVKKFLKCKKTNEKRSSSERNIPTKVVQVLLGVFQKQGEEDCVRHETLLNTIEQKDNNIKKRNKYIKYLAATGCLFATMKCCSCFGFLSIFGFNIYNLSAGKYS